MSIYKKERKHLPQKQIYIRLHDQTLAKAADVRKNLHHNIDIRASCSRIPFFQRFFQSRFSLYFPACQFRGSDKLRTFSHTDICRFKKHYMLAVFDRLHKPFMVICCHIHNIGYSEHKIHSRIDLHMRNLIHQYCHYGIFRHIHSVGGYIYACTCFQRRCSICFL